MNVSGYVIVISYCISPKNFLNCKACTLYDYYTLFRRVCQALISIKNHLTRFFVLLERLLHSKKSETSLGIDDHPIHEQLVCLCPCLTYLCVTLNWQFVFEELSGSCKFTPTTIAKTINMISQNIILMLVVNVSDFEDI